MLSEIQYLNNMQLSYKPQCTCNQESTGAFDILMLSLLQASKQELQNQIKSEINSLLQSYMDNNLSVNDIISSNSSMNSELNSSDNISKIISQASKKYNVDEKLIRSVIKIESNFDPNVVSSAGATGLMQIIPQNYEYLGITDPFDIEQNINGGTKELRDLLDRFDNNVEMALMGYNGGIGRMAQRGVKLPSDIYKMPRETQNYVSKVMDLYRG